MAPGADPFSTTPSTDSFSDIRNAINFTVINQHTTNVSYGFRIGSGSSKTILLNGTEAEGAFSPNETISYALGANYSGVMWVIDANYNSSQSDTLIESNFGMQRGHNRLVVDVSMVDGFTLPVTCSCNDKVITGCNLDLFELNDCPEELQGPGTCRNPLRAEEEPLEPVNFFSPCQGMAYTFPADHASISNMERPCSSGISCCIGAACPPHPQQDDSENSDGTEERYGNPDLQ